MPLQATSGAASYDAFGGGVPVVPAYIEDVFSCFLYTGTGASLTITNGIDLSTNGGLVWCKARSVGNHGRLFDTARGVQKALYSSLASEEATESTSLTAFNSNGFTLGSNDNINGNGATNVSWTFRKQPKFFDIVTYTGNGAAARAINHNLGSTPGCMFVKRTDAASDWRVYHRGCSTDNGLVLNDTAAQTTSAIYWFGNEVNVIPPTSTQFTVNAGFTNTNNGTYVAYLFAHDAGGFGLTGTDNVISCGSFNYNTDPQTVTIGYEPQWLMVKRSDGVGDWIMFDNMRGFTANAGGGVGKRLLANTSDAETANDGLYYGGATGFNLNLPAYGNYIYIAIRRGPMKVPTDATKVFLPYTTAASTGTAVTTNFPVDFQLYKYRAGIDYWFDVDRLRGVNSTTTANSTKWLDTTATTAEASATNVSRNWGNTGFEVPGIVGGASNVFYSFQRAPSFFDEVCYTGTGSTRTVSHNLAAVPQLIITKVRSSAGYGWFVYPLDPTKYMELNSTSGTGVTSSAWNDTAPTASVFTVGPADQTNLSGATMVAYLFATCAGVSKVGSYTGTGTTLQIDCGFTAGARFVLIKRTDSTGGWYVWDTARGIIAGNDPYLLLNSTAAEVTSTDYIDTYSAGFEISSTAPAAINANGGSFIFFAVA
jgi:hypothetical protein